MPFVNVKITRDGVTAQQKARIVAEITATLERVLGKRPEHTHIVIDEVDPENWGFAGLLTTEYRQQRAEKSVEKSVSDHRSDGPGPEE
jgi:4-oxalocrotonate tautomerase